ncbi:GNAT family N-acetyltransferase [Haloferax sp. MBLA0078]|uniref:GNAT family N-acetyltransferase n=2 Tax=Haloferacaceae TaxID=1644056 RepID=A0A6A8G943_9EURY|nr:GNAT family N-acetyltransferase [Haloferax sp. CBA1150]MRW96803.1 GNAT family N-acetyltransferase [Haloferax marinum]
MRDVWQVNVRCWVDAYDHILPGDALPDPDVAPDDDGLRQRFEYANLLDETDSGRYVVAVDESTPDEETGVVGFAATRWGEETKSFVDDDDAGLWVIYVDPTRWGAGIGSALLDEVTAAVPSRYDRLVLETFAANDVARQFYEARGFDVVERIETAVGEETYPAVVMARSLEG